MCKPRRFTLLVAAAALALSANFAAAVEVSEEEPNDPINAAQDLDKGAGIPDDGFTVPAVLGEIGTNVKDLDFFKFYYQAGDVVDIDLNNGYFGGQDRFNSYMALFDPDNNIVRENDNYAGLFDSFIEQFTSERSGIYTIGVSDSNRPFVHGGTVENPENYTSGDYVLVITNTPAGGGSGGDELVVNLKVKPGKAKAVRDCLNPKARGQIKVAILSDPEFDATAVDVESLRFGHNGDEVSLAKCKKKGKDVNKDGRLDLVCKFWNHLAGFEVGDLEGTLTGSLLDEETTITGTAPLKVKPFKGKGECRQKLE